MIKGKACLSKNGVPLFKIDGCISTVKLYLYCSRETKRTWCIDPYASKIQRYSASIHFHKSFFYHFGFPTSIFAFLLQFGPSTSILLAKLLTVKVTSRKCLTITKKSISILREEWTTRRSTTRQWKGWLMEACLPENTKARSMEFFVHQHLRWSLMFDWVLH